MLKNTSDDLIDLIEKMLKKDPEQRIDNLSVFEHPWIMKYRYDGFQDEYESSEDQKDLAEKNSLDSNSDFFADEKGGRAESTALNGFFGIGGELGFQCLIFAHREDFVRVKADLFAQGSNFLGGAKIARAFFGKWTHIFVDKVGNEECIDRSNRGRFGWGEYPAIDTTKDNHD